MFRYQKFTALCAAAALSLTLAACGATKTTETATTAAGGSGAGESLTYADMFSSRDKETGYDETETVKINLLGTAAQSDGENVRVDGTTVTVTGAGTFLLSGSLENGSVVVDAGEEDKIQLVLDNVEISADGTAPLYIRSADKVFITLTDGSENKLVNTDSFAAVDENNVDACLFSKEDLTVNGGGALSVTSEEGHGIVSKDSLVLTGGTITVDAARHALAGKDDIRVLDGSFTLTCGQDALHASNDDDETLGFVYIEGGSFEITAGDDAFHADSELLINGGSINVLGCTEGLEGNTVTMNGGNVSIMASDDGVNAAGGNDGSGAGNFGDGFGAGGGMPGGGMGGMMMDVDESCALEINGGKLVVNAEGDGLDSNGSILVSGGEVYVSGPTNSGNGAMDYGTEAKVTGGVVIATGAAGMAENFSSSSTQGSMLVSVSGAAGEALTLTDASGNTLAGFTPEKAYQCAVISAPGIAQGETYTVTAGSQSTQVEMTALQLSQVGGMGGAMGGGMGGRNSGAMGGNGGMGRPGENAGNSEAGGNMPGMPGSDGGMQPPAGDPGSAQNGGMGAEV